MPPSRAFVCLRGFKTPLRLALLCLLAACQTAPARPQYDDPNLLFKDDFSQTTSGWDSYSDSEKTTNYDNGQYVIRVDTSGVSVWAAPQLDFTDLKLEVDTQYVGGPVNNEFGVMCRYTRHSDGKHSFYFFLISSDGYYALGKVSKNVRTILSPADGQYQPSGAIRLDSADSNHLTATCDGKQMSLAINGTLAGQFEDDELMHGDVGVLAGTFDEPGVTIHFDNFEVRKP